MNTPRDFESLGQAETTSGGFLPGESIAEWQARISGVMKPSTAKERRFDGLDRETISGMVDQMFQSLEDSARKYIDSTVPLPHGIPSHERDTRPFNEYRKSIEEKFTEMPIQEFPCKSSNLFPQMRRDLRDNLDETIETLSEANRRKIVHSSIWIPKDKEIRGALSFIPQIHFNAVDRTFGPGCIEVSQQLFRLEHLLNAKEADLYAEGFIPNSNFLQEMRHKQANDRRHIEGTTIPIFSREGQRYLCENPEVLASMMRDRVEEYFRFLDFSQVQSWRESEDPVVDTYLQKKFVPTMDQLMRKPSTVYGNVLGDGKMGAAYTVHNNIVYLGGAPFTNPERHTPQAAHMMLKDMVLSCELLRVFERCHYAREQYTFAKTQKGLAKQKVPHLKFGVSHTLEFMRMCRENATVLIVNWPAFLESEWAMGKEEINPFVLLEDKLIPQLKDWIMKDALRHPGSYPLDETITVTDNTLKRPITTIRKRNVEKKSKNQRDKVKKRRKEGRKSRKKRK